MKTAEAKTASPALQRKANKPFFGKGGDSFLGNETAGKQSFFSNNTAPFIGSKPVQAKLNIGRPNDHYEKEADSMADQVVQRLASGEVQRKEEQGIQRKKQNLVRTVTPVVQSKCAECAAEEAKEEEKVQKKENKPAPEDEKKLHRKPVFESDAETKVQKKASKAEAPTSSQTNKTAPPTSYVITATAGKSAVQAKCSHCEEEKLQKQEGEIEESEKLQRKPVFATGAEEAVQKKTDQPAAKKTNGLATLISLVNNSVNTTSTVQAKCSHCEEEKLQKQEGEAEEQEKLQMKPVFSTGDENSIQRRCRECEEGNKVMMKPIAGIQRTIHDQTPKNDGSRTSIIAAAQGELGKVEARVNDGSGTRIGADRLLEYFHIAAPGVWDDSIIETAGAEMPAWCGIFSVWAHKKAGKDVGNWQMGKGVSAFGTLTPTDDPQPGDIGYINLPDQHHAVVKEVAGDTIHTIDGNSGLNSEVIENQKPRSEYTGFLTAFGGGSSPGSVQTKEEPAAEHEQASSSIEDRLGSTKGKGSSLPEQTRQDMEQGFGADFGNVRVHTDSSAVQLSKDLNAQAFTHGSDIYFNAGKYDTGSSSGQHLLAHELTHTLQQGGASQSENVQRYSWDEFTDDVSGAVDTVSEGVSDAAEAVSEGVSDAAEAVVDTAGAAVETVTEAASAAVDWLETQAGAAVQAMADALGGIVSITANGIEVRLPGGCPLPAFTKQWILDPLARDWMVPVFRLPLGPNIFVTGEIGLAGSLTPEIQAQLGPLCFDDLVITINPLSGSASISGGISITTAASLGAEVRGGVRGELNLEAIAIIGGVPVKVTAPLVGVEGGLAGLIRGIAAQRFHYSNTLSYGGGAITSSQAMNFDLGLGADLFAGAYAQLDVGGEHICRIYWQPYEWHGGIAYSLGLGSDLTIYPGVPAVFPSVSPPTLGEIPFDSIPLAINRQGFSDDCPILDRICEILRALNLLPSQNGGIWDWSADGHGGTYGPGPRLPGPIDVYQTDPAIPSGSTCRGACGPNCDTCEPPILYHYTDPASGQVWEYPNYRECNSNEGCRQHDAAFDWAAAEKGEAGDDWAITIMPWHMAANIECACNNLAGNCIAWIIGLPPYDMQMFFADDAYPVNSVTPMTDCRETNPDFTNCTPEGADRDEVLELWGMDNGYENFRGCLPHRNFPAGVIRACDLGPGRTFHCTATDVETGEDVTISIFECYCCDDETGASGSDWREPHLSIRATYDAAGSRGTPMISQQAFNQAQNHIRAGRNALALQVVVDDLVAGGHMNPALYNIRYVAAGGRGEGLTTTNYRRDPASGDFVPTGPSEVEIYTPAFTSVQWLVSTVMHEYQHVLQHQRQRPPAEVNDPTGEHNEAGEVEAYLWEIEHSDETGMAAQMANMRNTMGRLTDHYDTLGGINPARQATYTARYEAARDYVNDLQEAPPPLPGYSHVFHHGSDYDTVEILRTADITATGGVDFGRGFYTHTKGNWRLAREWAIRHSLGKKGWGVVTFPVPDQPWREEIRTQLYFRNYRSQPANIPINPETGRKFRNWEDFVNYNKRKGRQGALPDWSEFDVIEGPLWGRLSRTRVHQVMFTGSGVGVLNRPDVKPLRIMRRWKFLRWR